MLSGSTSSVPGPASAKAAGAFPPSKGGKTVGCFKCGKKG